MIIVRNSFIPFDGYKAMSIWPIIFVRKECNFNKIDERHEEIHGRQQIEMAAAGAVLALILCLIGFGWWSMCAIPLFYIWYITEWIIRLFIDKNPYRSISFEQEAYGNERVPEYLEYRRFFAWVKYLFKS